MMTDKSKDKDRPSFLDDDDSGEVFKLYTKANNSTHDVFLSDHISSEVPEYFELLHFLSGVNEEDIINVHLMNYGGDCQVGLNLCHAFKNCPAPVVMNIDSPCYSIGALLALSGRSLIMKPGTFLMFHNYSGSAAGKGAELVQQILASKEWLHESFNYFCRPFLTAEEVAKIKKDEDVYIKANDPLMAKRLTRHFKGVEVMK